MTVAELMSKLEALPPDADVIYWDDYDFRPVEYIEFVAGEVQIR